MSIGRSLRRFAGLLAATASVACASSERPEVAPGDAFREDPPKPSAEVAFVPPRIEEARLDNGLRVLVAHRPQLPVVAVQLAILRGVDQGSPAVATILSGMRLRGTRALSSKDFLDACDATGGGISFYSDFDSTTVGGWGLGSTFPQILDLVSGAVRTPALDPAEIELERASRIAEIARSRSRPEALAGAAMRVLLYPAGHPYAGSSIGTSSELAKVKKSDLETMQATLFGPTDAVLAVAGDVTLEQARAEAQRVFGDWKGQQKPRTPVVSPPLLARDAPRVVLVPHAGATQSEVLVAARGAPAGSADVDALVMVGSRLAGRITDTLRKLHHVTYDVAAETDTRLGPGPFTISTAVETRYTVASVREILAEIDRIRTQRTNSNVMKRLRGGSLRGIPLRFETVRATASTVSGIAIYDHPLDWYDRLQDDLAAVRSEDIMRVANTYLAPEHRVLVVVGDPALEPYLAKLGMGPVSVRQPQDVLP